MSTHAARHRRPAPSRLRLSRQARQLPPALLLRQVLHLAQQVHRPRVDGAALADLFSTIWRLHRTNVWTCADLREHGLLPATATRTTGHALAALHEAGGRLGPWQLERHRSDRAGRLWQLRRMW